MRVGIVGDPDDLCATYLGWLAQQRGAEVIVLPEHEYGMSWTFALREDPSAGSITFHDQRLALSDFAGVIVRCNPRPRVPEALGIAADFEPVYAIERRSGLNWLLDHLPVPVVNRPHAGRSNSSKPYQMLLLQRAGFAVPRWIATNDRDAAARFMASCALGCVYKSCSGLRCRVRRADDLLLARLAQPTAPVVVQEYIRGADVRVHVVGDTALATALRSDAVDYRFDAHDVEFAGIDPPPSVARLCVETARRDGLLLAGFDFRLADDGTWWCLEMNPVPTFLPYEAGSGQAIGDAILDLFDPPPHPPRIRISPLFELAGRATRIPTSSGPRPRP